MRKEVKILLTLTILLFLPVVFFAQTSHELVIPHPTVAGVYLNDQIMSDSNTTGGRKDPLRVYVLERGQAYYNYQPIRNSNWTLRIKAASGTGEKPIIYIVQNPTLTNVTQKFLGVRGNISLSNIVVSGYDESDPSPTAINGMAQYLIETESPGFDIVIDQCILHSGGKGTIFTTNYPRVVKVTNTLFTNCGGYLTVADIGNGRALDLRGGSCDTVIFTNNVCVNVNDRLIRHYSSTANIGYIKVDHNTFVNHNGYHGMFSFGKTGKTVILTNNLLMNPFDYGNDTDKVRQVEFSDPGEKDAYGNPRMVWVSSIPNDTTNFTISNNYYCVGTDEQAWFTKYLSAGVTGEGAPLPHFIAKKLGADSTKAFIKDNFTLTKIPKIATKLLDWYRSPTGGNKTKGFSTWTPAYGIDRKLIQFYTDTLNCKYTTTSAAYTGAIGGKPAGDLNTWGLSTGVERNLSNIPTEFTLQQNYPNPFNPTTNISYNLVASGKVSLVVYDLLGRKVATLVNEFQNAGIHYVTFDAVHSSISSGMYFYKLTAGSFSSTKKMMLIK
jgi:hypothetical protein